MAVLVIVSVSALTIVSGLYLYVRWIRGVCTSKASLQGKTVIVTGANTGIGFSAALDFAKRNARVILACRDKERGTAAREKIIRESQNKNVVLKLLNLASMKSIRKFAEEVIKEESRLDILINNAGMAGLEKKVLTDEGLELLYAVNHFGPFLLTNLLLDLLKQTPNSRIVVVSSYMQKWGKIEFDNLRSEQKFVASQIYNNTKLANVLFTKELARRINNTGVIVNCLHPGVIKTELLRHVPAYFKVPIFFLGGFLMKSTEQGAQTTIHCAVWEKVAGVSGKYFMDCREADYDLHPVANDEGVAKKLWEISEQYTGISGN